VRPLVAELVIELHPTELMTKPRPPAVGSARVSCESPAPVLDLSLRFMPTLGAPELPAPVPPAGAQREWLVLTRHPLPVGEALAWVTHPSCGAVVLFCGTVRDHADGRAGVTGLDYEAYDEQVVPRFQAIVDEVRRRWPSVGRMAIQHRIGHLELCETAVVVVVSAAHRDAAFEAGRFCIDTLKASAPIWKREEWSGGADWGTGAQPVAEVGAGLRQPDPGV
jgi:molybdopterin synthase catalytic subunit